MTNPSTPFPCILSASGETTHVQLSAAFDADPYWHGGLKMTLASFSPSRITLHSFVSDETAVSFHLDPAEVEAFIQSYTTYRAEREAASIPAPPALRYDPLDDGLDDHPF